MVRTIRSNADFEKQIAAAGSKLVVVDFCATWCGPCKAMEPYVKSLDRKFSGKAVFLKVDVDKFDEISEYYNVQSMPTFIFIKNNKKVGSLCGADEDKLATKVAMLAS